MRVSALSLPGALEDDLLIFGSEDEELDDLILDDEDLDDEDWEDLEEPDELEFDDGDDWDEDDEDGLDLYVVDDDEDEAVGW